MRIKGKCIKVVAMSTMLGFAASALIGAEINFSSYTSIENGTYFYSRAPLGCNYSESWKREICDNGNKWQMSTVINKYYQRNGALEMDGTTTLTNSNATYGFTGGTFVIAKDSFGMPICIVGAKTNFIVDSASANNENAEIPWMGNRPRQDQVLQMETLC